MPANTQVTCHKCNKVIAVGDPFYTAAKTRCPQCVGPTFAAVHKLTYLRTNHPRCFKCRGPVPKFYYELTSGYDIGLAACTVCSAGLPRTKKTLSNFGHNAETVGIETSFPPVESEEEILSTQAEFFRRSRVPEIPNGIAPCGHPGIHVFPNYVSCIQGCNK